MGSERGILLSRSQESAAGEPYSDRRVGVLIDFRLMLDGLSVDGGFS